MPADTDFASPHRAALIASAGTVSQVRRERFDISELPLKAERVSSRPSYGGLVVLLVVLLAVAIAVLVGETARGGR